MFTRLFLLLFIAVASNAQTGEGNMLFLKKKNKTIARYYKGSPIAFYTSENMPVSGVIDMITPDSLYLYQYNIRRIQRMDGGVVFDTAGKYSLNFSLKNIGSFPAGKQKGKNIITDGTLLMLAGGGYLILNIFNTTRQGDPPFGEENLPVVLMSAGAVITGYLLKQAWPKRFKLGKKYNLRVIAS